MCKGSCTRWAVLWVACAHTPATGGIVTQRGVPRSFALSLRNTIRGHLPPVSLSPIPYQANTSSQMKYIIAVASLFVAVIGTSAAPQDKYCLPPNTNCTLPAEIPSDVPPAADACSNCCNDWTVPFIGGPVSPCSHGPHETSILFCYQNQLFVVYVNMLFCFLSNRNC